MGIRRRSRTNNAASAAGRLISLSMTAATATVLSVFFLLLCATSDVFVDANFGFTPKTRLTWVNGIGYNTGHMEKEAPVIANYFGGKKVEFYHNPTKMIDENDARGYFSDLTQAGQQKYLGRITSEVNGLVKHLRDAVRSVGTTRNGVVVHIAHSQGALVTCLAAKQLTPHEMSKIEVISFGGATPVRSTPETPFKRCVNYYSVNDPLLFLNPSAESALRSGFNHHYQHNGNQNVSEDEFCFLAPRIGDPIADHMLLGPTYASALEWEGKRFERNYQSYLQRSVRSAFLMLIWVLSAIIQFLSLVWQKMLETQIKLRRGIAGSVVAEIRAIRMMIISILAGILAFLLNCWSGSETETTTPIVGNAESPSAQTSISKVALSTSSSDSAKPSSASQALANIDPKMQCKSLFGFRRETNSTSAITPEKNTITPEAMPVRSRWGSFKKEKHTR